MLSANYGVNQLGVFQMPLRSRMTSYLGTHFAKPARNERCFFGQQSAAPRSASNLRKHRNTSHMGPSCVI